MKTFATTAIAATLLGWATAHPRSLTARASAINDGVILNYALTLEHLEDTFYRTGLAMFSEEDFLRAGYDQAFYKNIEEVSYDEKTHVAFLTGALKAAGVTPVQQCTYDFGITSVQSFIAIASVLEGVGVTAYLGAAASIANKVYLTAAGSILTVEARHSSYIRGVGLKEAPFPQPFDAPLDFDEVYTLAAPFIISCPKSNPALPFKTFPSLSVSAKGTIMTNSEIELTAKQPLKVPKGKELYACWIAVTGPTCGKTYLSRDHKSVTTTVPAGFHGQSYVVLTDCDKTVSDETVVAGPAIVEVTGTDGGF